jgi:hypothetical protein
MVIFETGFALFCGLLLLAFVAPLIVKLWLKYVKSLHLGD